MRRNLDSTSVMVTHTIGNRVEIGAVYFKKEVISA